MQFCLLDRITQLEPGKAITAVKNLSLAEEYLADHFPRAPVMPGVMMLQSLVEAASWLIRAGEDFAHSLVVLREARSVKFANFVDPGKQLQLEVQLVQSQGNHYTVKGKGLVDGSTALSAKLVLWSGSLAQQDPHQAATDQFLCSRLRQQFQLLLQRSDPETSGKT